MTKRKESEDHRLLKEFAVSLLNKSFKIPKEHIYQEFSVGNIKFDVIAYPPVELKSKNIIGVECGNKKGNVKANYEHFRRALNFIDLIIWIPYSIFYAPYADLVHCKIKDIVFIQHAFKISENRFCKVFNCHDDNLMYALFISKRGRFPILDATSTVSEWIFE